MMETRQFVRRVRKLILGVPSPRFEPRTIRATADSFLPEVEGYRSPRAEAPELFDRVEALATDANRAGPLPLWEGYAGLQDQPAPTGRDARRMPDDVRTGRRTGEFFAWLVTRRRPSVVVEFGAAFGVSGMYWLAGLELAGHGELFSFEPNSLWAPIAEANMKAISERAHLTRGTFEDNVGIIRALGKPIDIAFIDAIHTSEFVLPQLDLVHSCCAPGSLIVLDDISFSNDMADCWKRVAAQPRFRAAAATERLGIVEVA